MLFCHFFAYSLKLCIEENKLTPLYQMEASYYQACFS